MAATESISVDLTGYKNTRGDHVEPGDYIVQVVDLEQGLSSNNNPMVTAWYEIVEGPEKGGSVVDRFVLTDKAVWRLVAFLQALNVPTPKKKLSIPVTLIKGRYLKVKIDDDEYNGIVRSAVKDYGGAKGYKSESAEADPFAEGEGDSEATTGEPAKAKPKTAKATPAEETAEPEQTVMSDSDGEGFDMEELNL